MPYRYSGKRTPVEGYCAECGCVKTSYARKTSDRALPGAGIPCPDFWHFLVRYIGYRRMLYGMNRRRERLTADELTRLGEELGGD